MIICATWRNLITFVDFAVLYLFSYFYRHKQQSDTRYKARYDKK